MTSHLNEEASVIQVHAQIFSAISRFPEWERQIHQNRNVSVHRIGRHAM